MRQVAARTVVIATGVRYRKLDVPRMEEFEGSSVYYAATLMEARLCTGDPVAVVGGGNSAGQATLFLARYANPVHLIVREADLAEHMSRYLIDRIERNPAVQVQLHTEVRELIGEHGILEGVVVEDNQTGERSRLEARHAVRVHRRAAPHAAGSRTRWRSTSAASSSPARRPPPQPEECQGDGQPLPLETSRPGVLAVGDVRSGSIKRVASAVGEGAMAVRMVFEHLTADRHALQPSGASRAE